MFAPSAPFLAAERWRFLGEVKPPPSNVTSQSNRAAGKLLRMAETAVCGKGSNDGASAPGR